MKRYYACPNCGSHEHLSARQSITYDAYQDVTIDVGPENKAVVRNMRDAELCDVEQVVTTWFLCSSPECEEAKTGPWNPDRERVKTDFQLEDLVLFPRDEDLCAKCDHHWESHYERAGPEDQESPCHECCCEDFILRTVHPDQLQLVA